MKAHDLKRRVMNMIGRCIISAVDDKKKLQSVQIEALEGEVHDDVERFQDYGFTSHPHPEAEAVVVFPSGLRSHGLVIAVGDRRYRVKDLKPGEVALYDDLGNIIKLGRESIDITAVTAVNVTSPTVIVTSDDINLGGEGGKKVARIGDNVDLATGKILTGSDKVKSA